MADRTFHKRFSVTARIGVVVFALLAGYCFWVKMAIIGIFLAIIIVGMIERILNTTYTFKKVKPIDRDDEMEYLIINEGRFSSNRNVPVCGDRIRSQEHGGHSAGQRRGFRERN